MRVFAGFYLVLEILFHTLAVFIPDTNDEKELSLILLGTVTLTIDILMFINFLSKIKRAIRFLDDVATKSGNPPSMCYKIFRATFFTTWFIIFTLDIIFIAFLRPAGSVYFINQDI
jgi:hypothetical protein